MGSNAKTYKAQCKTLGLSEAMGRLLEHWGGQLIIRGNTNTLVALIRRGLVTPKQHGPNGYEHYYTREGIQMINALREYWGFLPIEHYHSTVRDFLAATEPSNNQCGGEYELCREASKGLACSCPSVETPANPYNTPSASGKPMNAASHWNESQNVTVAGSEPTSWEPEFDRPEARECYFGCGPVVVAVFVDHAGITQGLCGRHQDSVSTPVHKVPTQSVNVPQTGVESLVSYEDGIDTPSGVLVGSVRIDGVDYDVKTDQATTYQNPNTWSVTLVRKSDSVCAWLTFPKGEDYRTARFYNVQNEDGISHPRTLIQAMREAIAYRLPNKPETEDETMTLDMLLSVTGKALEAASEALRPKVKTVCVVQERAGSNGMMHYHAEGCRDIQREARRYGASEGYGVFSCEFTDAASIIEHEYSDVNDGEWDFMISHANSDFDGLVIMPCLGGILPLGKSDDGRILCDGGNGRKWSLVTPVDEKRCDICGVHGSVASYSVDIDGKHVCGYCVDAGRTLDTLNSHSLTFYVETEGAGTKYECTNCRSIDTRGNFAEFVCEGDESPIHNAFNDDDSDAGFVETDSPEDVAMRERGYRVTKDDQGKTWVSFQHTLNEGDIVRAVGISGTYRVHCLVPGLPIVFLDGGDGREPIQYPAEKVYAV